MTWFKHDTDATQDAKIKKLLLRQGPLGYAVYFHCLELIASDISDSNLTFELEHDSEIIADNLHVCGTAERSGIELVQLAMREIVSLGLFEESNGHIFCFKMLKRLDSSMTSNPNFRQLMKLAKSNHDTIMIESCRNHDTIMQDKTRIEETRKEKSECKITRARDFQESDLPPNDYPRLILSEWEKLGDRAYQPDNLMIYLSRFGADVSPHIRGYHSDDVLAAIQNFATVAGIDGTFWKARIGLSRFLKDHLEKFIPRNFKPDDFKAWQTENRVDSPEDVERMLAKIRAKKEAS